jgi:hypothetical protein
LLGKVIRQEKRVSEYKVHILNSIHATEMFKDNMLQIDPKALKNGTTVYMLL